VIATQKMSLRGQRSNLTHISSNMPFIEVNNINLSYTEEGSGFPLVLLHGLSDDYNLWALLMPVVFATFGRQMAALLDADIVQPGLSIKAGTITVQ